MGKKNRAYQEKDIGVILLIKRLLHDERFTTQGVKQKLKNEPELIRQAREQFDLGGKKEGRTGSGTSTGTPAPTSAAANPPTAPDRMMDAAELDSLRQWVESTRKELREILDLLV